MVDGPIRVERREVVAAVAELYVDHRLRISPLALSTDEFARRGAREYRIARKIAEAGIAV